MSAILPFHCKDSVAAKINEMEFSKTGQLVINRNLTICLMAPDYKASLLLIF